MCGSLRQGGAHAPLGVLSALHLHSRTGWEPAGDGSDWHGNAQLSPLRQGPKVTTGSVRALAAVHSPCPLFRVQVGFLCPQGGLPFPPVSFVTRL